MSLSGSDFEMPTDFSGIARLFPLPNIVLYPGVVQALHIFEPRYREMASDALAGDQLISMSLLQEAGLSEFANESNPPICQTVCISKIVASKELPDGRFNLLVVGVKRARILRELDDERPYRMAEVEVLEDEIDTDDQNTADLRERLFESCKAFNLVQQLTNHLEVKNIVESNLPLGLLVDLISYLSQLDCDDRQQILELSNVEERCEKLIALLELLAVVTNATKGETGDDFPPKFSLN